ncbi:DUF1127 domain-containing protein [Bradyrhizobium sp. WSM1743]|uniref:DUF1127 domain-containing protein n=1 Tax=Bradyrhizobium sp. WSM1743 TaxID=318996 RepID=UPI000483F7ED|nr:DUF1127 domain-containing protein [Bradyrhizobium sp. WSM1743]
MSMTYGARWVRRTAESTWQVAILIKRLWSAVQERRGRQMAQAALHELSDRELEDIGTTRGEIDYVTSQRGIARPNRSTAWHSGGTFVFLLLCNVFILAPVYEAKAQCTAQDVLRTHLTQKAAPPAAGPRIPVGSAADLPVWKTIAIGTFRDPIALRNAMSAMGCGVGDSAAEVLARPAFTLSGQKTEVELLSVSAAELGLQGETASLQKIYAHAQRLGLGLAPAEVAPQLRLQYLDQPIGEFLIIAMEPIRTWAGEPIILTVANGGAGLILIGQDAHDDADVSVTSRFVFVRREKAAPAEAALVHD